MNIYDQLQAVEDRYEELGELLSDPDVVSDTKRFMELSKEEARFSAFLRMLLFQPWHP